MAKPLHIGVAAQYLDAAAGVGVVARGFLQGVAELGTKHRITAFTPRPTKQRYAGTTIKTTGSPIAKADGHRFQNFLWDQLVVPVAARRAGVDVLFWPHPTSSLLGLGPTNFIEVCDAVPWILPEYTADRRMRMYARIDRQAIRRAVHVVTISEHSARDIVRVLGIPPEKVTNVSLGPPDIARSKLKPAIDGPYVFYIGGSQVKKNPAPLLKAFLHAKIDPKIKLVIAGAITSTVLDDTLEADLVALSPEERQRVVTTGRLSDEELAAHYQHALCFAFPSIYEGFGVPILEAMELGCPVLSSTTTSMPEVAGEAAVLVDPRDPEAIAAGLERLVNDEALRKRLVKAGRKQVKRFSWKSTAERTLAAIEVAVR